MILKRYIFSLLTAFICILFFGGCASVSSHQEKAASTAYILKDARGYVTTFNKPPKRIFTYSMEADNMVLGFVASDQLVAINSLGVDPVSSSFAPKARRVQERLENPSIEKVLSLQPEVIFMPDWGGAERAANLRDIGLKVVVLKGARSLADIKYNISLMGKALHEEEKAQRLISMMESKLSELQQKVAANKSPKKRVLLLSLHNNYGGKGSVYDELCEYAGVVNCISAIGLRHGEALTKELMVGIDPDMIILPAYTNNGQYDSQSFIDDFVQDPALQGMKAVQNKSFFIPREYYLYNIAQDSVFGAWEIARAAYGEDFAQPDKQHLSLSGELNE